MRSRISHLLLLWTIAVLGSDPALARPHEPPTLIRDNGPESSPTEITREEVSKSLASLQRPFIENQGQFNSQAAYAIPLGNGSIFLDKQGALIFSFSRTRPAADGPPAPGPAPVPGAVSPSVRARIPGFSHHPREQRARGRLPGPGTCSDRRQLLCRATRELAGRHPHLERSKL